MHNWICGSSITGIAGAAGPPLPAAFPERSKPSTVERRSLRTRSRLRETLDSCSSSDAVKVGKKGVGQFDRRGVLGGAPQNRRGSNPEVAAKFSHKIIPSAFR